MSQSSETMNNLRYLGYPDVTISNNYYTAQVSPGIGVAIAYMRPNMVMVQFFPWANNRLQPAPMIGHEHYANFITAKATMTQAQNGELFSEWPFEIIDQPDILAIKCLIEETIKRLGAKPNDDDQRNPADPEAGAAVE